MLLYYNYMSKIENNHYNMPHKSEIKEYSKSKIYQAKFLVACFINETKNLYWYILLNVFNMTSFVNDYLNEFLDPSSML